MQLARSQRIQLLTSHTLSPPRRHLGILLVWLLGLASAVLAASAQADPTPSVIIDSSGDGLGNTMANPRSVAVGPDGSVYVAADPNVFRVQPSGTITKIMDASGDGTNASSVPSAVVVNASGQVFVGNAITANVFRIDPSGTITQILDSSGDGAGNTFGGDFGPDALAVDDAGIVYAASAISNNVFRITATGTITELVDGANSGGLLTTPRGVAVDATGNVFVTGAVGGSNNLVRITPSGTISEILDTNGAGTPNSFNFPSGPAIGPDGSVYVAGRSSDNVFRITPAGSITEIIDSAGDGVGGDLGSPAQVAVDPDGRVYVVSGGSENLLGVMTDGSVLELASLGVPLDSLAVAPSTEVFLVSRSTNTVYKVPVRACRNGIDDDGDMLIDHPLDLGCSSPDSNREAPACDDGVDNDGDTLIDFPQDPGCASPSSDVENAICSDGKDNDFDGLFDFPDDPGCMSVSDSSEREAGLVCDDGVDNDGDGGADFGIGSGFAGSDRGCRGPGDPDERSLDLPCDDGIDNDSDGQADYPNDPECPNPRWPSEAPLSVESACSDGADNDGDGQTDGDDPGCGVQNDHFESTLITTQGGVITAFLCETTSADCEVDANFSVSGAVVGAGRMVGPFGKTSYGVDIEIPRISFVGNLGDIARVELTDVNLGDSWLMPFLADPLAGFFFSSSLVGTIETFDASDALLSGPAAFGVSISDLSVALNAPISYCNASLFETGECTLFFDSLAASDTLDINGTPHRLVVKFDSILLAGTCGDGVVDPGESCDDGNEISGDCCSPICEVEPDGHTCDDAVFCNGADTCSSGVCVIHVGDPCPGPDGDGSCTESCDEVADACTAADPDGSGCTDGNACTTPDTCTSGSCAPGIPLACDDANGCTDNGCNPLSGCSFVDNSLPCDDAVFCNGADTCSSGACVTHAGDPCPGPDGDGSCVESCDEAADACTAADPDGSNCTDGNTCTESDQCAAGSCAAGSTLDCDDGDFCTADSCDELTGCANDPIAGCPPPVPAGGNAMWLLTALGLVGLGAWRLAYAVRAPLA